MIPPESFKGWVIPAKGKIRNRTEFQAIEVPISTPTSLNDVDPTTTEYVSRHNDYAKRFELVFNVDADLERWWASYYSPRIRFLPDLHPTWDTEAWEKRAALPFATGYHLFYTRAQGGSMMLNKYSGNKVRGDMFLMKLSGVVKEGEGDDERSFYVDADKDFEWDDYLELLKDFEYIGVQEVQKKKLFGWPKVQEPKEAQKQKLSGWFK